MRSRLPNKTLLAYLLLISACLFWAGNFIMGRAVAADVPPMALSFWRWLLAALLLLPLALPHLKKDWDTIKTRPLFFLLLGLLGGATYNALSYLALHTTTANNAFILNAAIALLIVVANAIILKIRPSLGQLVAIALAIIGILYIITEGNLANLRNFSFKTGDILIIITMISWAIYTALLPTRPKTNGLSFAFLTFAAAALWLVPAIAIEHFFYQPAKLDGVTISAILFAAVFPGLLAYLAYNKGVELIGGNRAGITIYLIPIFGAVLSYFLLGETLKDYHFWGFALIIAGVALSALKGKQTKKATGM